MKYVIQKHWALGRKHIFFPSKSHADEQAQQLVNKSVQI